jgi:phage terminase large subunit-like protein
MQAGYARACEYARWAIRKSSPTPRYVRLQCRAWLRIADGKDKTFYVDEKKARLVEGLMELAVMPNGLKAGQPLSQANVGYQWFILIAAFCTVRRDDPKKRKYETVLLEIARKNFKTYTVAEFFLALFLMEPKHSRFFSVAPEKALAEELRIAMETTIRESPSLALDMDGEARFRIYKDGRVHFKPRNIMYTPLPHSQDSLDGKMPSVFLADEIGAMRSAYPIEAMRSGQSQMLNRFGFLASTQYPKIGNPLDGEIAYAKNVLDGVVKDPTLLAMLYEPDERKSPDAWMEDDRILLEANPVAAEDKPMLEDLRRKRARAIANPQARENFLNKHCNIKYDGSQASESFVDIRALKKCRAKKIDWEGREVWMGLDLAITTDNVGVAMVADIGGKVAWKSMCFIPSEKIRAKSELERLDYAEFIRKGWCTACGDNVIGYGAVEEWILGAEKRYGVTVRGVGYDRYNAISTAQKIEKEFAAIEIKQSYASLHPATKLLQEKIADGMAMYETNTLEEINFQNAKARRDENMNMMISKKHSNGKVDLVAAIVNALAIMNTDLYLGGGFYAAAF